MPSAQEVPFTFPGQTGFYRGKVRDVYSFANHSGGPMLVMVASDRISAFDVVLPRPIPHKGQVLNQTAAHFLAATADLVPNWLTHVPDPCVSAGRACQPYPVEMVVRGYLAGHAWRVYREGGRVLCGVMLPDGLREGQQLPHPILTPTTKAHEGHDEDISREDLLASNLVSEADYTRLEAYSLALFERGTRLAAERGLILVDTKYEFGHLDNTIYLIDEIHTPDSSRYYYAEGYAQRLANGENQKQLSKEFVREWLIANDFQGKTGQQIPNMTDEWVAQISARYVDLYQTLIGLPFQPAEVTNAGARVQLAIESFLQQSAQAH